MATSEKINLWDRWFNRTRQEIIGRGSGTWHKTYAGRRVEGTDFQRHWVDYKVIDRVTGSETIKREYI